MATGGPIVHDLATARELQLVEREAPIDFVNRIAEYAVNWLDRTRGSDDLDRDRILAAYKDRLTSLLLSHSSP